MSLHNIDGIHQHIRALALPVAMGICVGIPFANRFIPALHRRYRRSA